MRDVYPDRAQAAPHAKAAITRARQRVLVMWDGPAAQVVKLPDLLDAVAASRAASPTLDFRLLLPDGLRTSAVIRALHDSPPDAVAEMLNYDVRAADSHPFFEQRLYRDFQDAYEVLRAGDPALTRGVRLCSHTPVGWLIVADDEAFFEPYTGERRGHQPGGAPSLRMPVLHFEGTNPAALSGLVDHFDRRWAAADVDLFQQAYQNASRERLIRRVFRRRRRGFAWIGRVMTERREHPVLCRRGSLRKPCVSRDTDVTLTRVRDGVVIRAEVADYSVSGLGLVLPSDSLAVGDRVRLGASPRRDSNPIAARLRAHFQARPHRVCWTRAGRAGLECLLENEPVL
jgi:hypothetical protein